MGWEEHARQGAITHALFQGARSFITAETAGTQQRVAGGCWLFFFKPQDSVPGVLSWGERALVCCDDLLSEARQKIGEDRPPVEQGALGSALAHASSPFSLAHQTAVSPLLSQLHRSAPGHLHKPLLSPEIAFPAFCKGGFFLNVTFHSRKALFEPELKICLALKLVTSCFYLLL